MKKAKAGKKKGAKRSRDENSATKPPELPPIDPALLPVPYKKPGRPSLISPQMADEICQKIVEGWTLREIGQLEHLPSKSTILRWAHEGDPLRQWFRDQYARARVVAAWEMFDEMKEIADDGRNDWMDRELDNGNTIRVVDHEHVLRSKLRLDFRKWALSKFLKDVFGKEGAIEGANDTNGKPAPPEQILIERQKKPDR